MASNTARSTAPTRPLDATRAEPTTSTRPAPANQSTAAEGRSPARGRRSGTTAIAVSLRQRPVRDHHPNRPI